MGVKGPDAGTVSEAGKGDSISAVMEEESQMRTLKLHTERCMRPEKRLGMTMDSDKQTEY